MINDYQIPRKSINASEAFNYRQNSRLEQSFNINDNSRLSIPMTNMRPEVSEVEYDFKARGLYTTQMISQRVEMDNKVMEFNYDNFKQGMCEEHGEKKDYILFENIGSYKTYDTICKICLSNLSYKEKRQVKAKLLDLLILEQKNTFEPTYCPEHISELKDYILMETINDKYRIYDTICKDCVSAINRRRGEDCRVRLWDVVILRHKDKIKEIKDKKIDLDAGSYGIESSKFIRENILSLVDELIYVSENFENEVCWKISGSNANKDEVTNLKNFIEGIKLTQNNEPILEDIGENEALKKQYIKLAMFLLKFQGIKENTKAYEGISASLKVHLKAIIQLRKLILNRLTDWIKFLTGDFYSYIFKLEGLEVDYNFLNGLEIDFFGGNNVNVEKIRQELEIKIRMEIEERYKLIIEDNRIKYEKNIQDYIDQIENFKKQIFEWEIKYNKDLKIYITQIEELNIKITQLNQQILIFQNRPNVNHEIVSY